MTYSSPDQIFGPEPSDFTPFDSLANPIDSTPDFDPDHPRVNPIINSPDAIAAERSYLLQYYFDDLSPETGQLRNEHEAFLLEREDGVIDSIASAIGGAYDKVTGTAGSGLDKVNKLAKWVAIASVVYLGIQALGTFNDLTE